MQKNRSTWFQKFNESKLKSVFQYVIAFNKVCFKLQTVSDLKILKQAAMSRDMHKEQYYFNSLQTCSSYYSILLNVCFQIVKSTALDLFLPVRPKKIFNKSWRKWRVLQCFNFHFIFYIYIEMKIIIVTIYLGYDDLEIYHLFNNQHNLLSDWSWCNFDTKPSFHIQTDC